MAERAVILATAGYDHTIRFWQAPTGVCQRSIPCADSQVNCLETTPDKQYIVATGNPWIRLYDCHANNANPVMSYNGHTSNVTGAGFQRDSKWMYTCSEDGTVKIWDLRAPGFQRDYQCKAPVNSVVLHPNQGELICVGEDGVLRIWDLAANTCSTELIPDGTTPLRSVTMASDASTVIAANNNGSCFVWNTGASRGVVPTPAHRLDAHNTTILKCLLSPDTKILATTSADHTIKLWDTTKGFSPLHVLKGHVGWVWSCAFSADSAYIVSAASDKCAKLWDIRTGEAILDYRAHNKPLTAVALNDS